MSQSITQGSDLSRIARHSVVYFIASILTKGLHALLLPLYTHWLTPDDYAVFSNLYAVSSLIVVATSLYLDNAYARFYFDVCDNARELSKLFSTLFIFLTVWGIFAASATYFLLSRPLANAYNVTPIPYVLVICLIPLFSQFNALAQTHFRSQHRSGLVTSSTYVLSTANAAVAVILLVGYHASAQALLWGALAGEAASAILLFRRLAKEQMIRLTFDRKTLWTSLVYSVGLIPLTAAGWLSGYSDRILIAWLGNMNDSGIYSVAFEIGRVINIIILAIFMVYGPMMFALLKEQKQENVIRIERFQSFYIHLLVGSAFFLSLFAPDIYRVAVSQKYYEGVVWVPIIAAAFVFAGFRKLYATPIYYHKLTLLISLGGIVQAGLNFLINYWFIPRYGAGVAAWSKLITMLFAAAFFNLLCRKYQPIRIDKAALGVTGMTLGGCLGAYLIVAYGLRLHGLPLFACKLAILAGAIVLTWRSRFGHALSKLAIEIKARMQPPQKV